MKTLRLLSLAMFAVLLSAASLRAATYTWTGAGFFGNQDFLWSNPNNWAELGAPQPGEQGVQLIFPNTSAPRHTTNDVLNLVIQSVAFLGANYAIHPATPSGITMTLAGANGGNFAIVGGGTNCQFGLGTRLHLGANGQIAVASGSTLTVRSRLSGVFGFRKLSPGTLRLSATNANTFTGTTLVEEGTLELGNGMSAPVPTNLVAVSGPLVIATNQNNATVRLTRGDQIGDASAVTVNEGGRLRLYGYDDAIGSLKLAGGEVLTEVGTLRLNGNAQVEPAASPFTESVISGKLDLGILGRTFDCAEDSVLVVSAAIRGGTFGPQGAGLTKSGPGRMILSGANTYPGHNYVLGGDLVVDHLQALGSTNGFTSVGTNAALILFKSDAFTNTPALTGERLVLYGGAQVWPMHDCDWEGPVELAGGEAAFIHPQIYGDDPTFTIRGEISGPGGFAKHGEGELWLMGLGHNTYAGRTYVSEGKLGLFQGGFGLNSVAVPGRLIVGPPGQGAGSGALVEVWKSETIHSNQIVVNHLGSLLFKGSGLVQTVSNLAVNGGVVDLGPTGLLKLTGAIASTNQFPGGEIRGRLDLGNAPRRVHVQSYRLFVEAAVSGGPGATLDVSGGPHAYLDLNASNSYQGLTIVRSGGIAIGDSFALGATNSGVIVTNTGTLLFGSASDNAVITKAFLQLHAFDYDISYAVIFSGQSNRWNGPVWLGRDTIIKSWNQFTFNGPISGPGGLEITGEGSGEVVFAGAGPGRANTYTGLTRVLDATLTLAKQNGALTSLAVPGHVAVEGYYDEGVGWLYPGRLRFAGSAQMSATARVSVGQDCSVECAVNTTNGVATISGVGDVNFQPHSVLHAGFDNADFQFTGRLLGGNPADPAATCFVKQGGGALNLWSTSTLTGAVEVVNGLFNVPGSLPHGAAYVRTNATLAGTGHIKTVRVDGGTFWPGGAQGDLSVRSCSGNTPGLITNGTIKFVLAGPTAQSGCDRLEVETLTDVENLKLSFLPGAFTVPVGEQFLIISNKSANSVLGKFNHPVTGANLDEGAKFFAGPQRFAISYTGGNGNDVVITRVADPVPAQIGGITTATNGASLNAIGEPGQAYRVEATFGFGGTNAWATIGATTMNNAGLGTFIDTDAPNFPMRFYRFVAP